MKQIILQLLIIVNICTSLFAQEAGKYERKSITYLNTLLPLDMQSTKISSANAKIVLEGLKEDVMLERFDYNPIPSKTESDFINIVSKMDLNSGSSDSTIFNKLSPAIKSALLPPIVKSLEATKEIRAQNLLTEQQKNSFITDKAKEIGITEEELKTAMNSAYILIPLVKKFKMYENKKSKQFTVSFDLGVAIYKVIISGDKVSAEPIFQRFNPAYASSTIGQKYQVNGKWVNYKRYAVESVAERAGVNLKIAIMELKDFRLSSQVTEDGSLYIGLNIGKKDGVKVDDKYRLIETFEDENGNIKETNSGWINVSSVTDAHNSRARVVSGQPYTGELLLEYPRLPVDVNIKVRNYPFKVSKIGDSTAEAISELKVYSNYGPELQFTYNLGPKTGVSHLLFGISGGFGAGYARGRVLFPENYLPSKITSKVNGEFNISLEKRFSIRRITFRLGAAGGYRLVGFSTKDTSNTIFYSDSLQEDKDFSLINSSWGVKPSGSLEFDITPSLKIGGDLGYSFTSRSSHWEYYESGDNIRDAKKLPDADTELGYSGVVWSAYISWNPARLKNNPFENLL